MTKARKTKTLKAKPAQKRTGKAKIRKGYKPGPKKTIKAKVDVTTLRGFARLAVTDPDRLKAISRKAGRKAQRLFGHKVRWSAAKARKLASSGGKAAQKKYRKSGHPWAAGSPLRPGTKPIRPQPRRRTDRRARPLPTGIPLLPKPGPDDQMIAPTTPLPESSPSLASLTGDLDPEPDLGDAIS